MNFQNLIKTKDIKDLINKLFKSLGTESFKIVDYWESDLTAIGIASFSNDKSLVYISTFNQDEGNYYVSIESPKQQNKDLSYNQTREFKSVNFERLVKIIENHID